MHLHVSLYFLKHCQDEALTGYLLRIKAFRVPGMYFQIFSQSIGLSTLGGVRGEEDPGRSATEPCAFPAGEGGESENPGS